MHVNDASRAVTVVGDLLNKKQAIYIHAKLKKTMTNLEFKFLKRGKEKSYISIEEARKGNIKLIGNTSQISNQKNLEFKF